MSDFGREVLECPGELKAGQAETKAEVKAIVQRLDKLNGSVARHQEAITSLQLDQGPEGRRTGGLECLARSALAVHLPVAGIAGFLVLTRAEDVIKLAVH